MATPGAGPRFEVRVVDEVVTEDLARCTAAARGSIEPLLATLREEGAPISWLRRCEEEGQDGTRLGGCVKHTFRSRPTSGTPSFPAWSSIDLAEFAPATLVDLLAEKLGEPQGAPPLT